MSSKITLRLAVLALGATFASAPALAQYGPPQSPGIGPNGDARYGLHNEAPGAACYPVGGECTKNSDCCTGFCRSGLQTAYCDNP